MLTFPTIKELQSKQNELDKLIHQQSTIKFEWISLWNVKRLKLALFTEVAEFANELKTFKVWRKKKEIDWPKAKEELIDCLCFFLGLCNIYQIDFLDFKNEHNEESSSINNKLYRGNVSDNQRQLEESGKINQLILTFFSKTNNLPENENWSQKASIKIQEKNAYYSWLQTFNDIIEKLKMDEAEVLKVYLDKFDLNKERVKKGC